MKKLSLIPLVIVIVVGLVFASGILFPDTVTLPRLPSAPGTIGGVLSLFRSDGTAQDASMLSGTYASGYLHNKDCSTEPINTVWKGIDANGQAICGNTVGLMAIARFTEIHGTVNVWHDGASGYTPAVVGEMLYQGDLIESDSTGTGTITFEEDNSIIRFWKDTDLELQYGDLGGLTVAEVILNDGRLWGRILSSTGVNLGGGGMVTGVRGTSVDIIKDKATAVYTMTITDSVRTDNLLQKEDTVNASTMKVYTTSTLSAVDVDGGESIPASTPTATISDTSFGGGTRFVYLSGSTLIKKYIVDKNLFYTDKWFVKNALLDVKYLSNLLETSVSIGLTPIAKYRINSELSATIETNNTGTLVKLLDDSVLPPGDITAAADILNQENIPTGGETLEQINTLKSVRLDCKSKGKTYFPGIDDCAGSWDTKSITDFQSLTGTLYGSKSDMTFTVSGSLFSDGIYGKITANGNYLEYTGDFTKLKGKTVTINYSGYPSSSNRPIVTFIGDYNGSIKNSSPYWALTTPLVAAGVTMNSSQSLSMQEVSFTLPETGTISRMIIGNDVFLSSNNIGVTITSISIK